MSDQGKSRSEKNEVFAGAADPRNVMPSRNVMKDDFGLEIPNLFNPSFNIELELFSTNWISMFDSFIDM